MVTITKSPKRIRSVTIIYKKLAVSIFLLLLLWLGIQWFSRFTSVLLFDSKRGDIVGDGQLLRTQEKNDNVNQKQKEEQQQQQQQQQEESLSKIQGIVQPEISRQELTKSILTQLHQLSQIVPLSPTSKKHDNNEIKTTKEEETFLTAIHKECIPGRDDSTDEINPTTHRKRECLRHVPSGKAAASSAAVDAGLELEERMIRQKPRIGIMIPPGIISHSFATWIEKVLERTGDEVHMEIEILVTSHVPVYGYGKSHGYTKLIRFVTLPMSLAALDAYLWSVVSISDSGDMGLDAVMELVRQNLAHPPSADFIGRALQLVMRWHCRMSHVSAHTAMLTLTLEDVINDPSITLASVLGFVWREDWEWEGHGNHHPTQRPPPQRGWKHEAEELVRNHESGSLLQTMLDQASLVVRETTSSAGGLAFRKAIQGAFASEMKRSSGMTSWPCPSFWEGVESGSDKDNEVRALQHVAGEMVPNCSDDDPFVRCTINKDRCEVKHDAKCK